MDVVEFKRILSCFAETPAAVDMSKGDFVVQLRDEVVSGTLIRKEGALFVNEAGSTHRAESWLISRVARVSLLADRILAEVSEVNNFVTPCGNLIQTIDKDPSGLGSAVKDAVTACFDQVSQRVPGTTSVLYLTSDAGEGKTTVIRRIARETALSYKRRETDWLVLPIPMGGRAFLRIDELVISSLMQRYRFSYWYFEGFIEMVRMGVLVPAFDGFEEMIVEESSGEAVSAVGNLVNQLNSEGSVLLAARKAFFEYQSFRTQARLFDAIGREDSVAFSRLALSRWSRSQFVEYGHLRGHSDPGLVFDKVAAKFNSVDHPLLTRAVLVSRLFDVALALDDVSDLVAKLGVEPRDYFHEFVLAIISREVNEKWIDRESRDGTVLLTIDDHLDLLSSIAREMWVSSNDVLRHDVIEAAADLYCDETKRSPSVARQVKERIKHHALLASVAGQRAGLAFDHEDFRNFFTGVSLGRICVAGGREDLRSFLRIASISETTAEEACLIFERSGKSRSEFVFRLLDLISAELSTSFVLENVGRLLIRIIDGFASVDRIIVKGVTFAPSAFVARTLENVDFVECFFAPTGIEHSQFESVRFERCRFERIEVAREIVLPVEMVECEIACVVTPDDEGIFSPLEISEFLQSVGVTINGPAVDGKQSHNVDEELTLTERAMRIFIRSTHVNEETFKVRLGSSSGVFFDNVVPELLKVGVLEKVPYRGRGHQERFRLGVPLMSVQDALVSSSGSFKRFLGQF